MHLFVVDIFVFKEDSLSNNSFLNLKYNFYNKREAEKFVESYNFRKIKQMFSNYSVDYIIQEQYISK